MLKGIFKSKKNNNKTDPVIIHMHIPKTAGTSLRTILKQNFRDKNIYVYHGKEINEFTNLDNKNKKDIDLIVGHSQFGIHKELRDNYLYLVILREPVDRIFSYYKYVSVTKDHPAYEIIGAKGLSFGKFLELSETHDALNAEINNAQMHIVAGTFGKSADNQESLRKAINVILYDNVIVGISDKFMDYLELLKENNIINKYKEIKENALNNYDKEEEMKKLNDYQRAILDKLTTWDGIFFKICREFYNSYALGGVPDGRGALGGKVGEASEKNEVPIEAVIWGYRLILGREPESEKVARLHQRSATSIEHLRQNLLNSKEFRQISFSSMPPADALPPMEVELSPSKEALRELWGHAKRSWEKLGRETPHHSVLTNKLFLPEQFKDNEDAFWQSGKSDLGIVLDALRRNGLSAKSFSSVFEFGCGVGRVTGFLARQFDKVSAADISEPHLQIAKDRLQKLGIANVEFHLLEDGDMSHIPGSDLVFTRIVLQHNAPPLMLSLLRELLGRVNKNGVIIFQLPVYMRGYVFKTDAYLRAARPGMEMHCLPQHAVFEALQQAEFTVLEVHQSDDIGRAGDWISNTILARKN